MVRHDLWYPELASFCKRSGQNGVYFPRRKVPPWVRHGAIPCCRDITNFAIVDIPHTTHKTERNAPGTLPFKEATNLLTLAESPPARRRWRPQADLHTHKNRCKSGGYESLRTKLAVRVRNHGGR